MSPKPKNTKENNLYLPIKQVYFDAIFDGTRDKEYRAISYKTFKRYIEYEEVDGGDIRLFYNSDLLSEEKLKKYGIDLYYYNDGVFPFILKKIKYLDLAVGSNKDRDTMTVEVTDISVEPIRNKEGNAAVISYDENDKPYDDDNGDFTIWYIVYHLGKIVKTDLKKDRGE